MVTAPSADAGSIYRNCTALHTKWKHGVVSNTPMTTPVVSRCRNFYHSTYWYGVAQRHNSGLDRDKDGIACEAR